MHQRQSSFRDRSTLRPQLTSHFINQCLTIKTNECKNKYYTRGTVRSGKTKLPGGWRRMKELPSRGKLIYGSMKDHQREQPAMHQWGPSQCHQQKSKLYHKERWPLRRLPDPKLELLPCNQNAEGKTLREHPWKCERENQLRHPRGLGHSSRYPSEPDHPRRHPRGWVSASAILEGRALCNNHL
jgi:hypothetical protein